MLKFIERGVLRVEKLTVPPQETFVDHPVRCRHGTSFCDRCQNRQPHLLDTVLHFRALRIEEHPSASPLSWFNMLTGGIRHNTAIADKRSHLWRCGEDSQCLGDGEPVLVQRPTGDRSMECPTIDIEVGQHAKVVERANPAARNHGNSACFEY